MNTPKKFVSAAEELMLRDGYSATHVAEIFARFCRNYYIIRASTPVNQWAP